MLKDTMQITEELVKQLIHEQFPDWQGLPVQGVANSGWDNRTFHLGTEMLIRLPCDEEHAPPIMKEYQWLPTLAKNLSIEITTPIALGQPSSTYPWYWTINHWIDGDAASKQNIQDMNLFAKELAEFLNEFRKIDSSDGPEAGAHNFYRGGSLKAYDHEMQIAIPKIKDIDQRQTATALWSDALSSEWQQKPVWVHGDLAVGNILVYQGKLRAIIDFGQLAVGDPACDLVIAWNFFSGDSRKLFKNTVNLDQNTWKRALGWAFWKVLCWPVKGTNVQEVLQDIYDEYGSM